MTVRGIKIGIWLAVALVSMPVYGQFVRNKYTTNSTPVVLGSDVSGPVATSTYVATGTLTNQVRATNIVGQIPLISLATNTPVANQVLKATSPTTATWSTENSGGTNGIALPIETTDVNGLPEALAFLTNSAGGAALTNADVRSVAFLGLSNYMAGKLTVGGTFSASVARPLVIGLEAALTYFTNKTTLAALATNSPAANKVLIATSTNTAAWQDAPTSASYSDIPLVGTSKHAVTRLVDGTAVPDLVPGPALNTGTLLWLGSDDGNVYHWVVKLVDATPVLDTAVGPGTPGYILPWLGVDDGNSYMVVLRSVDGVLVPDLEQL